MASVAYTYMQAVGPSVLLLAAAAAHHHSSTPPRAARTESDHLLACNDEKAQPQPPVPIHGKEQLHDNARLSRVALRIIAGTKVRPQRIIVLTHMC